MTGDVLFERRGALGLITMNRPKALNALTHDMARAIDAQLLDWAGDDAVKAVAIIGAGEKAFCAGGDIRHVADAGIENGLKSAAFFADEYRMNTRIKRFPKPYVAFMHGVTMGGGVGLSVHGAHRIAGDRTMLAMPETGIGLFPDVGGGYVLSRLPGETGMWLALTGARLKAADCLALGLCDLYIPTDRHADALRALEGGDPDAVTSFAAPAPGEETVAPRRAIIDHCFAADTLEGVFAALEADGSDWAAEQRNILETKSPTSMRLAFRQLRLCKTMAFEECMALEYQLARFCMTHPDFYEGVRALLIDRDNAPHWRPATLAAADDAYVAEAFAPLPPDAAWRP